LLALTIQPDGYINLESAGGVHVSSRLNADLTDSQKPFFTVSGQLAKPAQDELRAA
jgi:hypothetical protein